GSRDAEGSAGDCLVFIRQKGLDHLPQAGVIFRMEGALGKRFQIGLVRMEQAEIGFGAPDVAGQDQTPTPTRSRTPFRAVPQAMTSSSMSWTLFSFVGPGLKTAKFSKSVNRDSWTWALTSAIFSSPMT